MKKEAMIETIHRAGEDLDISHEAPDGSERSLRVTGAQGLAELGMAPIGNTAARKVGVGDGEEVPQGVSSHPPGGQCSSGHGSRGTGREAAASHFWSVTSITATPAEATTGADAYPVIGTVGAAGKFAVRRSGSLEDFGILAYLLF